MLKLTKEDVYVQLNCKYFSLFRYGWRIDPMFWIRALFFNVIDGTGEFPTTYLFICKFEKRQI